MKKCTGYILIVFLFLISTAFAMGSVPGDAPEAGKTALDFTLPDLQGKDVVLSSFRGKVVFLNFWATWCPPCRSEMPSMQALHKKFEFDRFKMLAVSIDKSGKSAVESFVKDGGYTFKVLLDPQGQIAAKYKVSGIPTTFIIDKKGNIVDQVVGGRDWVEGAVIEKLKKLIK